MNNLKGKKALITGGLGFIGSNLAHYLYGQNVKVTIVDSLISDAGSNIFNVEQIKDKIEIIVADIGDDEIIDLLKHQDFIFNLAGEVSHKNSMQMPLSDLNINCFSQLKFLEACRKSICKDTKILHTSTRQIYGSPKYIPIDENHPINPPDINGIHKFAGEQYHTLYNKVYGLKTCVLRLTNTFGPRQLIKHNRQGFIPWFIKQVVCGEEIKIFGDGSQLRDINYVDDVVSALILAATSSKSDGKVYNLGSQEPVSLKQFTQLLVDVAGKGSYEIIPFPEDSKKIDVGSTVCDYSKIHSELGWTTQVSLEEGIKKTLKYYERYLNHYL